MGILRAIVPRKKKDIIVVSFLAPLLTYVGWNLVMPSPPDITVHTETQYPKEVIRGSYFYLNFDLTFGRACNVTARRFITGSDNIEYLALEDSKEVTAGQRVQYTIRVPVALNIPYGPATIRSDFEYQCDFWSRHVRPIFVKGRTRQITVLAQDSSNRVSHDMCSLPEEPGFSVIRAHYRRKAGSGILSASDQRN